MIRRSIPWTIQPPIGVGPNKKWIDRGLVALFDCRQARELISGDFATNRTSLVAPSTRGIAADFSGSANQQYAHRPAYVITGPITIAALCAIDALTNYSAIISKMGTTTTNVPYELRVGAAATDSFINFARANTSVRDRRGASNRLTAPFSGLIAVTAPSGLIESAATLYVNNVPTVLSSNASGTGLGTDNGSTVWIGRRYDGATQLDGRIYYVPLFNTELSASYLKELYDNPWDIYEPQQRNIYVSVAGGDTGAGSATITFACSGIGSALFKGIGSSAITFTNSGIGKSLAASTGSSAITFNAPGVGTYLAGSDGDGVVSISFTASGIGRSTSAAIGSASISFSASAVGTYPGAGVLTPAIGSATMTFNATGYGNALQSYTWNDITYISSTWTDIQPPSDIWTDIITP